MAAQDENWRRCNKCQGLFYTGNPTFGTCPTGGGHDYSGSANYSLTYNDPSQPQQPPYVPSPPAGQGLPSYGQPPYGVAPVSDPIAPQEPRKKGRRWLKIIIMVLVLFSTVASAFSFINSVLHDPVPGVVNQYYTAIKNQDYTTAYGYLAPGIKAITGGEFITLSVFTQEAQDTDTAQGKVRNYSIENSMRPINGSGSYTATVIVSVTRNGAPYDVNLNLQQIGGEDWKITRYDRL